MAPGAPTPLSSSTSSCWQPLRGTCQPRPSAGQAHGGGLLGPCCRLPGDPTQATRWPRPGQFPNHLPCRRACPRPPAAPPLYPHQDPSSERRTWAVGDRSAKDARGLPPDLQSVCRYQACATWMAEAGRPHWSSMRGGGGEVQHQPQGHAFLCRPHTMFASKRPRVHPALAKQRGKQHDGEGGRPGLVSSSMLARQETTQPGQPRQAAVPADLVG